MFIAATDTSFFEIIKNILSKNEDHINSVREIFQFPNNFVENPIEIINSFTSAMELASNGMKGYEAYYYYGSSGIDEHFYAFFPYCIILREKVFFLNIDSYVEIDDKKLANKIRDRFENLLFNTKTFLLSYHDISDFIYASTEYFTKDNTEVMYAMNSTFCAARMADEKLIKKYVPSEYCEMLISYCNLVQQIKEEREFIFLNGIEAFAKYGKIYDFPVGSPIVLDKEDRIYSLNKILAGLGTSFFIIDDRFFPNTNLWSIAGNTKNGLCFYKNLETKFIQLDEANIVSSFIDFFEVIQDSHFVLKKEDAKREICEMIRRLE